MKIDFKKLARALVAADRVGAPVVPPENLAEAPNDRLFEVFCELTGYPFYSRTEGAKQVDAILSGRLEQDPSLANTYLNTLGERAPRILSESSLVEPLLRHAPDATIEKLLPVCIDLANHTNAFGITPEGRKAQMVLQLFMKQTPDVSKQYLAVIEPRSYFLVEYLRNEGDTTPSLFQDMFARHPEKMAKMMIDYCVPYLGTHERGIYIFFNGQPTVARMSDNVVQARAETAENMLLHMANGRPAIAAQVLQAVSAYNLEYNRNVGPPSFLASLEGQATPSMAKQSLQAKPEI